MKEDISEENSKMDFYSVAIPGLLLTVRSAGSINVYSVLYDEVKHFNQFLNIYINIK